MVAWASVRECRPSGRAPRCVANDTRPLTADAVADVRRERRMDDLDRLKAGIGDAVEEALAGAEQDGDEVEDELVDHAGSERLAHGRCAAGDVDAPITRGLQARANAASKPSVTK